MWIRIYELIRVEYGHLRAWNMEEGERSLDTTGETPWWHQGHWNFSHQADKMKVRTEVTSALFRYCMCWRTRVLIRHVRLFWVTFRILPSTLVTCTLAAYGSSISPWRYLTNYDWIVILNKFIHLGLTVPLERGFTSALFPTSNVTRMTAILLSDALKTSTTNYCAPNHIQKWKD